MTIIVNIKERVYTVSIPVEVPDVEQFMCAMEKAIKLSEFSMDGIEDYILEWATEIKMIRDGKD